MPLSPNPRDAVTTNDMFEEHLAEIALDWVREPDQASLHGRNSWSPATGFITLLEESHAELIDLTASSKARTLRTIDLTGEPVVTDHTARVSA